MNINLYKELNSRHAQKMKSIIIQKANLTDILRLQKIGRETFFETFVDTNTEENMQKYLEESFAFDKLSKEISNPNSRFFIASLDGKAIGYLKINVLDAQSDLQDPHALEIERIYVLQAFHGKKVGQLLYQIALDIAVDEQYKSIWLGVWEENHRAQRFYEKNGFSVFDKHIFRLGDDEQTDLMMKKYLL